jgi:hypothetical protein
MESCPSYGASGDKNNIPPSVYLTSLHSLPYRFPHPPFDPITFGCFSDLAPDYKTNATVLQVVAEDRNHQQGMELSTPLSAEAFKVGIRS